MEDKKIKEYLDRNLGIKVTAEIEGVRKYFPKDENQRLVWKITISRDSRKMIAGLGDSLYNTNLAFLGKNKIETFEDKQNFNHRIKYLIPMASQIDKLNPIASYFESVDMYHPETFEDFCSDFGYSDDSISAKEIYQAIITQTNDLQRIFSDKEFENLRDFINAES